MNMVVKEKEHLAASNQVHPRRLRTSSVITNGSSGASSDESRKHPTPERYRASSLNSNSNSNSNSTSPGFSKKSGKHGEYQLLENGKDGESDRDYHTSLSTIPASPDVHPANELGPPSHLGLESGFHAPEPSSFVSHHELAHGSVSLDEYGPPSSKASRNRSYSAAAPPTSQRPPSGSGHQRRTSLANDPAISKERRAAAKAATGHYTKQPVWMLGLGCVILGSVLDFAALAFVGQAVVAPLGSLTLVSNVFLAPILLKEKVNRKQLYCTFLIVAGSCLAVGFAPHEDNSPDIDLMFDNFGKARFIVYGIICALCLGALRFACWKLNKLRHHAPRKYAKVSRYHTFAYAACAGIMGAQSVLFAKCTAMLLAASIAGDGLMFVYWGTYFVLLGLGVTIYLQIRWLNSGLRMFSALMIVPIFQSFWILVSVISGMIFFGEYDGVFNHTANAILFPFGLLLTIAGVYMLTQIRPEEAAHPGPSTSHRRRSRTGTRASSLSGPSGLIPKTGATMNSVAVGTAVGANGEVTIQVDAPEVAPPSTPLIKNATASDHYGVTTPPASSARHGAMQGVAHPRTDSIDRSINVGSYSESGERHDGALEDEYMSDREHEDGDERDASEEPNSGGSSGDDELANIHSHGKLDYAVHSLAPINFPMFLLPRTLMEEPPTPRPYFEENSSGFESTSSIGLGGLPYTNLFRIAPVTEEGDEENPIHGSPPITSPSLMNGNGTLNGTSSSSSSSSLDSKRPQPIAKVESNVEWSHTKPSVVSSTAFTPSMVLAPSTAANNLANPSPASSPSPTSSLSSSSSHELDLSGISSPPFERSDLEANGDAFQAPSSVSSSTASALAEKSTPSKGKKNKSRKHKPSSKSSDSDLQESLL